MRIIVDAMGGDNAPQEIVKGAVRAHKELGVDVTLVGKIEEVKACLAGEDESAYEIVDAREVDFEVFVLDRGVVPTEDLKELAVTGRTLVRRHDTIGRVVLAPCATHSEFDHFCLPFFFVCGR